MCMAMPQPQCHIQVPSLLVVRLQLLLHRSNYWRMNQQQKAEHSLIVNRIMFCLAESRIISEC
jgi:hypothetical protein